MALFHRKGTDRATSHHPLPPGKAVGCCSALRPSSCLPLTREVASPKGLTEGEIGRAYGEAGCTEGAGCERSPSAACGDSSLVRGSQALRGDESFLRGKRSPAADAGLECRRRLPQNGRTGGSGGHFALGTVAPRRPFCPLSAGGKWTISPQNRFCGGPVSFDRLGRRKTGSLRHDGGTRRRGLLGRCARRRGTCPYHTGAARSPRRNGISAETPGIKAAGSERNQRIVSCAQAEGLGVLQAVLPAAF